MEEVVGWALELMPVEEGRKLEETLRSVEGGSVCAIMSWK
jgi:hypothetical protein